MFFNVAITIILLIVVYSFISSEIYAKHSRRILKLLEEDIRRRMFEERHSHYLVEEKDHEDKD